MGEILNPLPLLPSSPMKFPQRQVNLLTKWNQPIKNMSIAVYLLLAAVNDIRMTCNFHPPYSIQTFFRTQTISPYSKPFLRCQRYTVSCYNNSASISA